MDTTKYYYNSHGLLYQSKRGKQTGSHEIATYYYNSSKHRDSIVTLEYLNTGMVFYKTKETFSEFDNASNPLKKLFLFKETFLRSLSRNNYMHYDMSKYDFENTLVDHKERNWTIPHDTDGRILF